MFSLKSKIYKVEISVEVKTNLFINSARRFVSWAIRWFVLLPGGSHASAWGLCFSTQCCAPVHTSCRQQYAETQLIRLRHRAICCSTQHWIATECNNDVLPYIALCSLTYFLQTAICFDILPWYSWTQCTTRQYAAADSIDYPQKATC